jgi:hypothetical protein
MYKNFFLAALVLILAACTAGPAISPTPPANQIEVEEAAVFASLLTKMYQNRGYVIMGTTATSLTGVDNTAATLDYVLQNIHSVDPATFDSFKIRNQSAGSLRADMDLGSPYTLLSQAARNQIFGQNQSGWDVFYNHFPQAPGITTLSRVGFNSAFDQALVYIGTQSNWQVGNGYYVLLKKVNGTWVIDQQVMIWVS